MVKSKIQSILIPKTTSKLHAVNFPKEGFTLKQSHKWLLKHNFKIPKKVDETINFYRYRQKLPDKRYTYTTKVLPNGVELVLMWRKPSAQRATRLRRLEGGISPKGDKASPVKRIPKEIDPELTISKKEYDNLFTAYNYFKSYQLKDLIRQFVDDSEKNISYKTANKKRLLDIIIRYNINPSNYIIVEKNPIMRVPTNVLKKYGVKQNTDEEQQALIEEMQSVNPLKQKVKKDEHITLTLQKHQEDFIKQFVFSQLRGAVVFHGVGSGKTLTAVVSSYFYLTLYPNNKVVVISPSALLYNFINGMQQYGLNIQDKRYEFLTYEKYIRKPNIISHNSLLIIDEAHNFRTEILQQHITDPETGELIETKALQNKRGFAVLKYGGLKAHKIIALTGTAFVNEIYDIENLLAFVDGRYPLDKQSFYQSIAIESNLSEYFGHRISYFPSQKTEFFPEMIQKIIPIYMTEDQQMRYFELKNEGNPNRKNLESKNPNAYYSAERYATNAVQLENNPKINKIVELLKDKPTQKFIIYTVAQDAGIRLLEKKLNDEKIEYKVISGRETTSQKEDSKKYFNGFYSDTIPKSEDPEIAPYINNKYRVLLITKAGSEGVDTKNCQNLILLDHQWNDATTEQIIARAVRFKSHYALKPSERYVNVYILLFCFKSEELLMNKLLKPGFNDWVGAKNEFTSETTEYKQISGNITKVKNKVVSLEKQFVENEKMKTATIKELFEYYLKQVEKLKEFIIKTIPELKEKLTTSFNLFTDRDIEFYNENIRGENSKNSKNHEITYYITLQQGRKKKSTQSNKINYFKKLTGSLSAYGSVLSTIIKETEGYGDLESPEKGSIDVYLYILSKTKLKNINEFILNFGNKISLFETYEKKLLPLIESKEKEYIKTHKRGLTDKEQIDIYKEVLSKEIDALEKLPFNFAPSFESLMKKTRGSQDKFQQFYTSEKLAQELKNIGLKGLKGNIEILEPSAGFGNLIKPLITELNTEYHIDLIDIDPVNRRVLKELVNTAPNILNLLENRNFLTFSTSKRYDLIIMNPPFHLKKGENSLIKDVWDYNFVDRAFGFLKEGGRIVAITGTSWSFKDTFDEFKLFNDAPQDYLNMEMKKNGKVSGKSSYLKYSITRKEKEPFIGSAGKKIYHTVDIFVIEKINSTKDSKIIGKSFYLSQKENGKALQNNDVDFNIEQSRSDSWSLRDEQKEPDPPLPKAAPIEEVVKEEKAEEVFVVKKKKRVYPFVSKKGGNINNEELAKFVDAGYKTKSEAENIDGYTLDKELSTKRDKVYANKEGKVIHTISGTDKAKDWSNNLLIPFGLHEYSNRYKNAEKIQNEANKKYGKENVSVVSHSQSGNIAQNLAKKKLVGDENVTLNPAIIGSHKPGLKVVKSSGDIVSALTIKNKKDKTIKSKTWNPLTEHSSKILTRNKK